MCESDFLKNMKQEYKQLEKLYKNNLRCAQFFGMEYCSDTQWWYERAWKAWKFCYLDETWRQINNKKILWYIAESWKKYETICSLSSVIIARWDCNESGE